MANQVLGIYKKLDQNIQAKPHIRTKLHSELSRMVSAAYTQSMNSDEGYCFRFILPTTSVLGLYNLLGLDKDEVGAAFQADWKFPNHARMYNDPYYQILLLIVYYGIRNKDDQMINNALLLLLQKLWNGRKYVYFKMCDKRIMSYVINHMVNKKHNVSKYDTPLALLKDYSVPSLMKKYRSGIERDVYRLRQLFMQAYNRIDQMFAFNFVTNMRTGRKEAQGGLLPMYMKAHREGLYQSTPTIMRDDSNESDESNFDQYSTLHNRDSIVTAVTDFITLNSRASYPNSFISEINRFTKVSTKVIEQILMGIHDHTYYDLIHDILTLILSRTKSNDKNDICNRQFMNNVKRHIISSKNTPEIKKLQKMLGILLSKIFEDKLKLDLGNYGKAQQMQICNALLYGIIYNLQKQVCQN